MGCVAINRALEGIEGPTVVHLCFGYARGWCHRMSPSRAATAFCRSLPDTVAQQISIEASSAAKVGSWRAAGATAGKQILLGVLDLGYPAVETAAVVAERIPCRAAIRGAPDHLIPAPDCGMKYLPRETAFLGKLRALAEGAAVSCDTSWRGN